MVDPPLSLHFSEKHDLILKYISIQKWPCSIESYFWQHTWWLRVHDEGWRSERRQGNLEPIVSQWLFRTHLVSTAVSSWCTISIAIFPNIWFPPRFSGRKKGMQEVSSSRYGKPRNHERFMRPIFVYLILGPSAPLLHGTTFYWVLLPGACFGIAQTAKNC